MRNRGEGCFGLWQWRSDEKGCVIDRKRQGQSYYARSTVDLRAFGNRLSDAYGRGQKKLHEGTVQSSDPLFLSPFVSIGIVCSHIRVSLQAKKINLVVKSSPLSLSWNGFHEFAFLASNTLLMKEATARQKPVKDRFKKMPTSSKCSRSLPRSSFRPFGS